MAKVEYKKPWIILITDRRALGAPVRAVATYPATRGLCTTLTPHRVRRFATKADAARWLRKRVGPPGRDPHRLFSIVKD